MGGIKPGQAREKPELRKIQIRHDMKLFRALDGDFIEAKAKPRKTRAGGLHHQMAGFGQFHFPVTALKQRLAQFRLQPRNLFADGGLRDVKLLPCFGETLMPRSTLKNPECIQGGQSSQFEFLSGMQSRSFLNLPKIIEHDKLSEKRGAMSQLYPFTDPVTALTSPPTVMRSGSGCHVTDTEGREYLDAVSGLWCASLGFSNERLIAAAAGQMGELPYYHSFMGRAAESTEMLAEKLASKLPGDLNHVFFGCSGSEAVDTAAKLVRFYWNAKGQPGKKHIIAREAGYHGSGILSASLTGMSYCHDGFDLPDPSVLRAGRPHYYQDAEPGESEIDFSKRRAAELEALIQAAGPETIGGFIGEPVIGSGGVIPPPEGYWAEIQAVLARHDILLIADEIITGFGRTGAWFASEKYDIKPDLMTMAKQLTGAYFRSPPSAFRIGFMRLCPKARTGLAHSAMG